MPWPFERLRAPLPVARDKTDAALATLELRLHDMQSCIAREHGFASWMEPKESVSLQRVRAQDVDALRLYWLRLVYGGDVAGGPGRPRRGSRHDCWLQSPDLIGDDAFLACAIGDEAAIRRAIDADAAWVNRGAGLLNIPPFIAVTHSSLARLDAIPRRPASLPRLLLDRSADPTSPSPFAGRRIRWNSRATKG